LLQKEPIPIAIGTRLQIKKQPLAWISTFINAKCGGVISSYIKTCHSQHWGSITPRGIAGLRLCIHSCLLYTFNFLLFTWPTDSPSYYALILIAILFYLRPGLNTYLFRFSCHPHDSNTFAFLLLPLYLSWQFLNTQYSLLNTFSFKLCPLSLPAGLWGRGKNWAFIIKSV
jgi:hypothetical protein